LLKLFHQKIIGKKLKFSLGIADLCINLLMGVVLFFVKNTNHGGASREAGCIRRLQSNRFYG